MTVIFKDVQRADKARLVGSISRNDDGFLQGTATVARSGILEYIEGGKVVRELIRPEELAREDSLKTLAMKPITNDHPSVKLITPQNYKQYQVGHTGDLVESQNGLLQTSVLIADAAAIQDIEVRGKRELSCGYTCDLKEEPGTWEGQRYDREQINRRYNHVAICDLGRAGAIASLHLDAENYAKEIIKLHLDAADVYEVGNPKFKENDSTIFQRSDVMPVTIKLDGIEYPNQAPEVLKHIEKLDAKIADLTKQLQEAGKEVQTKIDAKDAEVKALKEQITKKDSDIAALPAKIAEAAKARAELVKTVTPHLDEAAVQKIDTMTDGALKKAVVVKAFCGIETAKAKIDSLKDDDAGLQTWYDAALSVLTANHNDSVMAQNRLDANGIVRNDGQHPEGCRCDACGKMAKSKEDAEQEVTQRYKKTQNRDALMR